MGTNTDAIHQLEFDRLKSRHVVVAKIRQSEDRLPTRNLFCTNLKFVLYQLEICFVPT
jgi:hypothetical protein